MKKNLIRHASTSVLALGATIMTGAANLMASADAAKTTTTAKASNPNLKKVTTPIIGLINTVLTVLIPLVAAIGAVYCVSIGVKYSRAEEPQEREKAKQHLKSAIIGFVLIFILIVALRIATPEMVKWMNKNS